MAIRFDKVSKSFGPKEILREVSFEIQKGEIIFIIGKSGMGKSVTLKHIIGVLSPDAGHVYVDGACVDQLSLEEKRKLRTRCGMVFQFPALFDFLTVGQNIGFGIRDQFDSKKLDTITQEKAALVNLSNDLLNKFPPGLSYGTHKRISIARTLAPQPEYLLFDEPTTGLDPVNTRTINHLILDLSRKLHVTSVVVSHDMGCALEIADRILVLDQGKILALDSPKEIRKSKLPLIQDFLHEVLEEEREEATRP